MEAHLAKPTRALLESPKQNHTSASRMMMMTGPMAHLASAATGVAAGVPFSARC